MYKLLWPIILVFLSGAYSSHAQSPDSLKKAIRTKYQAIRSDLKSFDTVIIDVWNESTEGGQTTGYFKKKNLKLIESVSFGEKEKNELELYFENGLLFFVYEKHYTYNRPIYWGEKHMKENNDTSTFDPKKTIVAEDRYYFHREKLIRWLDTNQKVVDLTLGTNPLVERHLISHAHKLRDKVKK